MKDNLARKPQLTVVEGGKPQVFAVPDIVPELSESPVREEKRWWVPGKETSLWLTSLGIVLLAYTAPLAWWLRPDRAPGANLPPPAAMVVELAPMPVAPPGPEQAETTPPPPEPVPPPEPPPEPEPELPPVPEVEEAEVAINPAEEPPPEETPFVEEVPPAPEEPTEEETPPEKVEQSTASAPPEAPQEDVVAAAPNQGVSAPVMNQNRVMNWQNSLMLKLNDAKRYPTTAQRSRQEGVAYLRFTMDREGTVLSASIERSSGSRLLDEETLALIERAQPLPQPPDDMKGEALEFVVPVEFSLRR